MLNLLSALPPFQPWSPERGVEPAPFQWIPAGVAFFRRQARPMIGCACLGILAGVVYLATATPKYTADATVVIDTRSAHPVGNQQAPADWQSESAYVDSQVELIRSAGTLRVVVDHLHLDHNPLFVPAPGPLERLVMEIERAIPGVGPSGVPLDPEAWAKAKATTTLSRMLDVSRVATTSVVDIGVRTPERGLSAQIANAVTNAYTAQQLAATAEETRRAGVWLQNRVGELRKQAVDADRAVQEYKAKHNIVDVGTSAGVVGLMNEQELGALNEQVTHAQTHLAETQARYERAKAMTVNGVTSGMLADALHDQVMVSLLQQYGDAVRREADLTNRMGPTHGAVILQHEQVLALQRNIQSELNRLIAAYRGDYEVAQTNLQTLETKLKQQVAAAAQTDIQRTELRSLQSSAQTYRQIYENFLQRFTQAMQDQSYPISDARVSAPALPPMDRSSPRSSIVLAVALTIGTMLGVVIAVTREAMDSTVRTLGQLAEATGLGCLGTVPQTLALAFRNDWAWRWPTRVRVRSRAKPGMLLVPAAFRQATVSQDSAIAQAVHAVRVAATRQSARGREVRVIGCVSATRMEGTSTFAANLAFAMAASGQRAALVDWNEKTPWLTDILSPDSLIGVQELAAREATLHEVELKDADSGLRFIGQSLGGRRRFPPGIEQVRAMLVDLRLQYDVVVLDLPPMQASSIALRLSELVDGFVLVTRWGSTPRSLLSETLSRTAAVDALFLGVVLNRCAAKRMRLYPGAIRSPVVRLPLAATSDA